MRLSISLSLLGEIHTLLSGLFAVKAAELPDTRLEFLEALLLVLQLSLEVRQVKAAQELSLLDDVSHAHVEG